ncbi:MAG: HupE/UreJ family protein [Leptolyngbyaceae cyanobacterium]
MNSYRFALKFLRAGFPMHQLGAIAVLAITGLLFMPLSALAHHPFGGETPTYAIEAFLSGLGHPIIGLDHLAFVITAGLLAAVMGRGLSIPIAFVIASLAGTGIHMMELTLPASEFFIAASVLLFGILLAVKKQPHSMAVMVAAAIAGIFHGYAYGEAIVGAEMGPLAAYLFGFTFIQMAIALAAHWIGKTALAKTSGPSRLTLRFAGFVVCGCGVTFLSTLIVDTLLPV